MLTSEPNSMIGRFSDESRDVSGRFRIQRKKYKVGRDHFVSEDFVRQISIRTDIGVNERVEQVLWGE